MSAACPPSSRSSDNVPATVVDSNIVKLQEDIKLIKSEISSISDSLRSISIPSSSMNHNLMFGKSFANAVKNGKSPSSDNSTDSKMQDGASNVESRSIRDTILKTFHSEIHSFNKRSSDVVVSGLAPSQDISDMDLFMDLIAAHLSVTAPVVKTHRLGDPIVGKIQLLVVTLSSPNDATVLLAHAKLLRNSTDPYVQRSVYLNKHLTKAEANLAYLRRHQLRSSRNDKNKDAVAADSAVGMLSTASISFPTAAHSTISQNMKVQDVHVGLNPGADVFSPGLSQSFPSSANSN